MFSTEKTPYLDSFKIAVPWGDRPEVGKLSIEETSFSFSEILISLDKMMVIIMKILEKHGFHADVVANEREARRKGRHGFGQDTQE